MFIINNCPTASSSWPGRLSPNFGSTEHYVSFLMEKFLSVDPKFGEETRGSDGQELKDLSSNLKLLSNSTVSYCLELES